MNDNVVGQFMDFEKKMLGDPETFFPMFEAGFKGRSKIIWKEFLDWQAQGGKVEPLKFREIPENKQVVCWSLGNEHFAQTINNFAPFSVEQYKNGLSAVFSFLKDRPQYFKFRKLDGMFNPLQLLLYKFL